MSDVYVYYFMRSRGPAGEDILSRRQATLETVKSRGQPVMGSQTVVDHTEVDSNGFVIGGTSNESHPMDALWAQIRSLELRANSRDSEALSLNDAGEADRKYILRLESRELRSQAEKLKNHRSGLMIEKLRSRSDEMIYEQYHRSPSPG